MTSSLQSHNVCVAHILYLYKYIQMYMPANISHSNRVHLNYEGPWENYTGGGGVVRWLHVSCPSNTSCCHSHQALQNQPLWNSTATVSWIRLTHTLIRTYAFELCVCLEQWQHWLFSKLKYLSAGDGMVVVHLWCHTLSLTDTRGSCNDRYRPGQWHQRMNDDMWMARFGIVMCGLRTEQH